LTHDLAYTNHAKIVWVIWGKTEMKSVFVPKVASRAQQKGRMVLPPARL
jgi:hypothetical protein